MDTETCSTKLQDLNEDCLRHIFEYLSFEDKLRFITVCSKWIQISPGFWRISQFEVINLMHQTNINIMGTNSNKRGKITPNSKLNSVEFREIILSCGPTFQKLIMWLGNDFNTSKSLVYCFDGMGCYIDDEFSCEALLDILIEACCDLKTLEIDTYGGRRHVSEKFHALFLANKKLAEIHIRCSAEANLYDIIRLQDVPGPAKILHLSTNTAKLPVDKNVDHICELLKSRKVNLKKLRLRCTDTIHASRLLRTVANYAKGLQVLSISDQSGELDLRVANLSALVDLEELSIAYYHMTKEVVFAIADGCKKLKKLKLDSCPQIYKTGINVLMTSLPDLVAVSLRRLDMNSISQTDAQFGSNLQKLEIDVLEFIGDDEWKKISVFKNLEELHIHEYAHLAITKITDEDISVITAGCKKLRKIVLYACQKITGEGINTIMTTLPNLESVELLYSKANSILHNDVQLSVQILKLIGGGFTEDALKNIPLFKNLKVLQLESSNVTNEVVATIHFACQKLKKVILQSDSLKVVISGCPSVQSKGINRLPSTLLKLESLVLDSLDLETMFLKDSQVPNLQRLIRSNNQGFSYDEFEKFLPQMPQLNDIYTREEGKECQEHVFAAIDGYNAVIYISVHRIDNYSIFVKKKNS